MLDVWSGFEEEDEGEKKKQMTEKVDDDVDGTREKSALDNNSSHKWTSIKYFSIFIIKM